MTGAAGGVGTRAAAFTSAALIASQVAGKAARDALFLTSFPVTMLPAVTALSAGLSLAGALWISRVIARRSPATVLPRLFAVSALGLIVEWIVQARAPAMAAVAVYLHMAVFGPLLLTAFWSLVNERFDPHSARHAVGRIALGGTVGGVLGALLAWQAASHVALPTIILLLAALHVACLLGTLRFRARSVRVNEPPPLVRVSTVTMLRQEPYLRSLALLVALGAILSALLDYVFSREAVETFASGSSLLTFFALFWLAIAVLSLVMQLVLGQRALERLGLAANMAFLPLAVIVGGIAVLAAPGLIAASVLRGGESVQRNTMFRSAYELLYTPLSERQKRSVKVHIDIGFDRIGTLIAAGLIALGLAISPSEAPTYLVALAIALGAVTLAVVRTLHAAYTRALAHGLRDGAVQLALPSLARPDTSTEYVAENLERDRVIQRVEALRPRHASSLASPARGGPAFEALLAPTAIPDGRQLLSADVDEVSHALRSVELSAASPLTAYVILLLAHKRLHVEALAALCRAAPAVTGQLIDALVDRGMDFVVRRRIPIALAACTSQRAAEGLLIGLVDARFEVRYACGRALWRITDASPDLVIPRETIVDAIVIEVEREAPSAAPVELDPSAIEEASALVDSMLALDRVDRTLEHVFTILGLHLDREPLRMAYRALHHPDIRHRGTGLEYLQTVLPRDIREAVWPLVGALAPLPPPRSARDVLADLARATVVHAPEGGERD